MGRLIFQPHPPGPLAPQASGKGERPRQTSLLVGASWWVDRYSNPILPAPLPRSIRDRGSAPATTSLPVGAIAGGSPGIQPHALPASLPRSIKEGGAPSATLSLNCRGERVGSPGFPTPSPRPPGPRRIREGGAQPRHSSALAIARWLGYESGVDDKASEEAMHAHTGSRLAPNAKLMLRDGYVLIENILPEDFLDGIARRDRAPDRGPRRGAGAPLSGPAHQGRRPRTTR